MIANSNDFGKLFGDRHADIFNTKKSASFEKDDSKKIDHYFWTVIFLSIGAVAVDFSSDTLQSPSRAYVLDVCVVGRLIKPENALFLIHLYNSVCTLLSILSIRIEARTPIFSMVVAACINYYKK